MATNLRTIEIQMGNPMNKVLLELAFPPSSNHYWRYVNSQVLKSKDARSYIKAVGQIWMVSRQKAFPKDERLKLEVLAMPKDKRRRDLDNLLKVLCDALESAGVFKNDSQIDEIVIKRGEVHPEGKLLLTLNPIEKE
jgi:crossover junction endodeoxyribonuclease RusA